MSVGTVGSCLETARSRIRSCWDHSGPFSGVSIRPVWGAELRLERWARLGTYCPSRILPCGLGPIRAGLRDTLPNPAAPAGLQSRATELNASRGRGELGGENHVVRLWKPLPNPCSGCSQVTWPCGLPRPPGGTHSALHVQPCVALPPSALLYACLGTVTVPVQTLSFI